MILCSSESKEFHILGSPADEVVEAITLCQSILGNSSQRTSSYTKLFAPYHSRTIWGTFSWITEGFGGEKCWYCHFFFQTESLRSLWNSILRVNFHDEYFIVLYVIGVCSLPFHRLKVHTGYSSRTLKSLVWELPYRSPEKCQFPCQFLSQLVKLNHFYVSNI